ncbi:hypothetical protein [Streptomyces tauricus]|uniref:hypothetical protein n=1 Tax=Streptomyces tauricus TaxID=68274 RepID=UPI0033B7D247
MVRRPVEGEVHVHYGQICVESDPDSFGPGLAAADAAGPELQRDVALLAARRACEAAGLDGLDWVAAALTALAERRPLPPPFDDSTRMREALHSDPRVPDRTVGQAVPPEPPPFDPPAIPGARVLEPASAPAPASAPGPQPAHRLRVIGPAVVVSRSPVLRDPPTGRSAEYSVSVTTGSPDPSLRVSQPHMALPAVTGAAEPDPLRAALDAVYAAVATFGERCPALLDEVRAACEGA